MFQEAIAEKAANLIVARQGLQAEEDKTAVWVSAAENCVLARVRSMRLLGGLPRHRTPLSPAERIDRLQTLLDFWANGCVCAVDEVLFADVIMRHRPTAVAQASRPS